MFQSTMKKYLFMKQATRFIYLQIRTKELVQRYRISGYWIVKKKKKIKNQFFQYLNNSPKINISIVIIIDIQRYYKNI